VVNKIQHFHLDTISSACEWPHAISSVTMQLSLLVDIPEELAIQILAQWLQLNSVANLDSAFCNTTLRAKYLQTAYGENSVLSMCNSNPHYEQCASWCLKRKAKVDGVWMSKPLIHENISMRKQFLSIMESRLRWATINAGNADCRGAVLDVIQRCPNIEMLKVSTSAVGPTSHDATLLWDECLLSTTQTCRRLQELTLVDVPSSPGGLGRALESCARLTRLVLGCADSVVPIQAAIPSLTYLDINHCGGATDALMLAIATKCPAMETLNVFHRSTITDVGVRAVLQGCPLLLTTDVENATGISRELRVELAKRRDLNVLDIVWVDMNFSLLMDVLRVSPSVTRIKFSQLPWLKDRELSMCAYHCPLLELVFIYACSNVGMKGMLKLLKPGNQIRELHVTRCPQLGDAVMFAAAQHCPLLETFRTDETYVSDGAVTALAKQCGRLQSLWLQDSPHVTMTGVRAVAEHCRELRYLALPNTLNGRTLPRFNQAVQVVGAKMISSETCAGTLAALTRWESRRRHWVLLTAGFCGMFLFNVAVVTVVRWATKSFLLFDLWKCDLRRVGVTLICVPWLSVRFILMLRRRIPALKQLVLFSSLGWGWCAGVCFVSFVAAVVLV
jgi:hypothetical protein